VEQPALSRTALEKMKEGEGKGGQSRSYEADDDKNNDIGGTRHRCGAGSVGDDTQGFVNMRRSHPGYGAGHADMPPTPVA